MSDQERFSFQVSSEELELIRDERGGELDGSGQSVRLDWYLVYAFQDAHTRSYLVQSIKSSKISVNNKIITKPRFLVKPGDSISGTIGKPEPYGITPKEVNFDVIFEHEDFLIINKPAGLLVHHSHTSDSTENSGEESLVQGLLYRYKELKDFNDPDIIERPGIVHRLDRDTSGLLVVARNPRAHARLSDLFKNREIKKIYYAITTGYTDKAGDIDFEIGRHKIHRYKMSHDGIAPKPAFTSYQTEGYFKLKQEEFSLIRINLKTGRTHQIRVHMRAVGHPLLGDSLYGSSSKLITRQALHAKELSFNYLGEAFSFTIDFPDDMKNLLDKLEPVNEIN